jgi:pimeloyl-ACP methyl ester carboxylesterase
VTSWVEIRGQRLEYVRLRVAGETAPTLVFLHEGLGSVALWKDFPRRLAHASGCNALVYSRQGYGLSSPLTGPREPDFMHVEALQVLPAALDAFDIRRPILFGHSDGASIALIHAGSGLRPVRGAILLAPHVMVEEVCLHSIAAARAGLAGSDLGTRLAPYHTDPEGTFRGWCDIWLDPRFRDWNIEAEVARIRCPLLAIQGYDDEYGTMEQIDRIARLVPDTEQLRLKDCRHSPHRDQPDAVIAAATRFIDRLRSPA